MSSMNNIAIQVQGLSKVYRLYDSHLDRVRETFHPLRKKYHREYHALKDVTFEVNKGEFLGIIGRNGSGKSTLLQIISGVLQPTSGCLEVDGKISALLELGAGFNPEFTGRENVYMNASLLGISQDRAEERFPFIESFADIGTFIDQPVKTYSSGMFVRLAFAVAISVKPSILIVDEALAVGDIFFQQKCIRYMQEEMKECTKLLVTHDMHAVMNLCERVLVLEKGVVGYSGTPLEGVEYYTKAMQNELFHKNENETGQQPGEDFDKETLANSYTGNGWLQVENTERAGAAEINILKARLTSLDKKEPIATAVSGDQCHLELIVESEKSMEDILFGYLLKDRVGNGICGDNTLSLDSKVFTLPKGKHLVSMDFIWPDVAPDSYLLTVGIGQGNHPLHHVIQCWAHNIINIKGLSTKDAVHGIFTNPLENCEVVAID